MKVVLLKQGVHEDVGKDDPRFPNACTEICGAVVLLKAENPDEENIIIDTGNWGFEEEILTELEKQGVKQDEIKWIVNTHMHFDHHSNNYLFKNAVRVSKNGFWFADKSGNWFDDPEEIKVPGIKIISTPGHAPDHRSIIIESEGKTYVISGDAIQEQYIKEGTFGVPPNQDYVDSARKIVDMADVIIPGHGKIIEGQDLEDLKKAVYAMEVR
jgi:glyoxylase-like metal-dependent hydrolase (beta-lactamase superfamily II)